MVVVAKVNVGLSGGAGKLTLCDRDGLRTWRIVRSIVRLYACDGGCAMTGDYVVDAGFDVW